VNSPRSAGIALALLPLAALAALSGCEDRAASRPSAPPAAAPIRPPSAIYTTRGIIRQLPEPGRPQTEFQVEHEAIDNFKNQSGLVVGMNAMIMPFPLGPGVTLDGFNIGDTVEITFAIWWDGPGPEYHATRVVKLPAETKLEFRAARPAIEEENNPATTPGATPTPGTPTPTPAPAGR
jgi:hypothetical protein